MALLARVKPEDRVGTDYTLIAALSGREVIWQVRHLYLEDSKPPHWTAEWPVTLDRLDTLVVPPDDPVLRHVDDAWTMEAEGGGYTLWRRTRPPLGGFPPPPCPDAPQPAGSAVLPKKRTVKKQTTAPTGKSSHGETPYPAGKVPKTTLMTPTTTA